MYISNFCRHQLIYLHFEYSVQRDLGDSGNVRNPNGGGVYFCLKMIIAVCY
jgi:hypothetical protein